MQQSKLRISGKLDFYFSDIQSYNQWQTTPNCQRDSFCYSNKL